MSDEGTQDVAKIFDQDLKDAADRGRKRDLVEDHRLETQVKRIERSKKRLDMMKEIDLDQCFGDEFVEQMDEAEARRIASFEKRMPFINPVLTQMIRLVAQELVFCGAVSGRGKSTTVANVVAPLIAMKPRTKILVISNEEKAESFLNRVICLFKGWNINDFKNFTPDQLDSLKRHRRTLIKYVHVVDPEFPYLKGAVFTLEGVQAVLENALSKDYGCILIDYYQKISKSEEDPRATKVQVLTDLSEFLDGYVKRSPAPVVMMGQLKTENKERTEFEDRIKECKAIYQNATQNVEIVTDKELLRTVFIKRKDRWDERDNVAVEVGFDRGRYVPYTEEFRSRIAHRNLSIEAREEDKKIMPGGEDV